MHPFAKALQMYEQLLARRIQQIQPDIIVCRSEKEIPDNLKITLSMDKDEIFQQYGKDRVKGWPVRNYCKNFVQKALSFN